MARKSKQELPDHAKAIKDAARGHWAEIIADLAGISIDMLDGKAHPCPKCGGKDRFRFTNQDDDGSIICNQCARRICGDGLETIRWATGWTFPEIIRRLADRVGVDLKTGKSTGKRLDADPAEHLKFISWSDLQAAAFCVAKPPITPEAIKAVGGRMAIYRNKYTVIALPVCGKDLDHAKPVGWVIYNVTGGTLPVYGKDAEGKWAVTEWVKIKTMPGTKRGLIGVFNDGLRH